MTRRERLERKQTKREEWAEKAEGRAAAHFDAAQKLAHQIPLGQPILVGHHSEGHARRDAERIGNKMDQGCTEMDKAQHHASKAAGLEHQLDHSVFSDDPDAVEALEARIAEREAECARVKKLNAAIRREQKAGLSDGWLQRIGATEEEARAILRNVEVNWRHEPVFPSYHLTNLRARIRADRERLTQVQARQARQARTEAAGGVLIERIGTDWCSVTFEAKPARAVLDALRAAGYRWSGGSWTGEAAQLPAEVGTVPPDTEPKP